MSGTQITNTATITFDPTYGVNKPITTNRILNTLDTAGPTSSVQPLPGVEPSTNFTVSWSGQDETGGSGLAFYDVYVSDNGGAFTPWLTGTTQTSATYPGTNGHTYGFYSVATDNVGNRQAIPAAAQATTQIVSQSFATPVFDSLAAPTITYGTASTTLSGHLAAGTLVPPGDVAITLDGVTEDAPIDPSSGNFAAAFSTATLGTSASPYTVTLAYAGSTNFAAANATSTLTINPATLTVTALSYDIGHGDSIPTLNYAITGFVNNETAAVVVGTPSLSVNPKSADAAGRYPIAVDTSSLSAANYVFAAAAGTLTVHPKVLDVRVDYGSKSISLSGLQRDLPFTTIKAIDILFSDDVAVNMGQLSLTGANGKSYGFAGLRYSPKTDDATWTLPSALGVDRLMMALDGETFAADPTIVVNPFATKFAVLPGDFNGDGVVNSQDMVGVRNQMQGVGDPSMIGWADLDGNGVVDLNDYNAVRQNIGKRLP